MRPSLRAVLILCAGLPVALLPAIVAQQLWVYWIAYAGFFVAALGLDAILGLSPRRLRVEFEAPETIYIGEAEPLELRVRAVGAGALRLDLLVDTNPLLRTVPLRKFQLSDSGDGRPQIPLRPVRRGLARVQRVHLRWTGPLGLAERSFTVPISADIPVVPNVGAVRRTALRFFAAREALSGLKVERYVGDGSEFESLREYVPGLDHRAMNWKATARHRTLLCQDYRAERNHQVVIAVDSGHLMCEPLGGIPRVDHAVNAALLLSFVCLRTGDRAGWCTFDERMRGFLQPRGGAGAFRNIQQRSAEIEYATVETNFTLSLTQLSQRLRRRSLVVVLTDFVDTITAELMMENLDRLARRHLVLFVTLRDPGFKTIVDRMPERLGDVYEATVAADFERERNLVLRRLRRRGVQCIDAAPENFSADLLNRYLEVKRREMF